jgi:hypothetical protein
MRAGSRSPRKWSSNRESSRPLQGRGSRDRRHRGRRRICAVATASEAVVDKACHPRDARRFRVVELDEDVPLVPVDVREKDIEREVERPLFAILEGRPHQHRLVDRVPPDTGHSHHCDAARPLKLIQMRVGDLQVERSPQYASHSFDPERKPAWLLAEARRAGSREASRLRPLRPACTGRYGLYKRCRLL